MSRIRSIHPGFATDDRFTLISRDARLFYLLLLTECDDQGIFAWKTNVLKMRIFPVDNIEIETLLGELVSIDAVCFYEIGDRKLGAVRNFRKYQRPKYPNAVHTTTDEIRTYVHLTQPISEITQPQPPPIPRKGEKTPQRKEGGGRMKGEEVAAAPISETAAVEIIAIIRVFDDERDKVFGHENRRQWPVSTDSVFAERWIAAGASALFCQGIFHNGCLRKQAAGTGPPGSLKYFHDAVTEALKNRGTTRANGSDGERLLSPEELAKSQHDTRVKAYRERNFWLSEWGPKPDAETAA